MERQLSWHHEVQVWEDGYRRIKNNDDTGSHLQSAVPSPAQSQPQTWANSPNIPAGWSLSLCSIPSLKIELWPPSWGGLAHSPVPYTHCDFTALECVLVVIWVMGTSTQWLRRWPSVSRAPGLWSLTWQANPVGDIYPQYYLSCLFLRRIKIVWLPLNLCLPQCLDSPCPLV